MFFPEGQIRVFLYGGRIVDMRNSFDGLYALARHGLQQDPLNGQLFAFVNRRATQMRVLYLGSQRLVCSGEAARGREIYSRLEMRFAIARWTGRRSS